jgi:hypothetical protein
MSLAMRTDITSEYTARIPDMTTGIRHWGLYQHELASFGIELPPS